MKQLKDAEWIGYFLIFIAGGLWGIIGIFVKQMEAYGSQAEMTSMLRVAFAFLIMLILCLFKCDAHDLFVNKKTLIVCAFLGIICHGAYNICYSIAVTTAGVAVSGVLLDIAPVFTLFFSMLFFKEKCSVQKFSAIIINILGCVLTATNGKFDVEALALNGILCGIGAGVCYSLTAIIGRFAAEKTNPFVMSMYSYFFAMLFLGIWTQPWRMEQTINKGIIIWGILYALIPTALAYVLYYQGLQKVKESSKVPVIASIEVVIASIIGVVVYQEKLGAVGIVGMILVLSSIFIMNQKTVA